MNAPEYLKRPAKFSTEPQRQKPGSPRAVSVVLGIFVAGFGLTALYFYTQWSAAAGQLVQAQAELADVRQNPGRVAKAETQALVERVGQLIELPAGEEPTVATVADPDRLKTQPFFQRAKLGDRVLIYTNAKKAYLYDPVNHKIIEVAPVTIGNPSPNSER